MRLLILTIVMMGGLALVMEFALVDTARLTKQARPEPVEVTFHTRGQRPWKANVTPKIIPGRTRPGRTRSRPGCCGAGSHASATSSSGARP